MRHRLDQVAVEPEAIDGDHLAADAPEVVPIRGWWWILNGAMLGVAWLAANLAHDLFAAAGGDAGYSGAGWETYLRYPVEDLVFDAPLIAVGAIPVLLVAWNARSEWPGWKRRGLILAASFLVPVPHLFVLDGPGVLTETRNVIWFGVFLVLAGLLIHPPPEEVADGESSSVLRLQDWGGGR